MSALVVAHTLAIVIEWDPAKAAANLRKHRVRFADAATVFDDPAVRTLADPDSEGEARYVSLGRDLLGRVLVLVWTDRGDAIRRISARRASRGEVEQLTR